MGGAPHVLNPYYQTSYGVFFLPNKKPPERTITSEGPQKGKGLVVDCQQLDVTDDS